MTKSQEILNSIEQSLLNLTNLYESLSSQENLTHDQVKEFDTELGDFIERFKDLKAIDYTVSDIELEDTMTRANTLVEEIQNKLDTNQFVGAKGDKGLDGQDGNPFTYDMFTSEQLALLKGEKGDNGDFVAQDYNSLNNKPIDTLSYVPEFFKFSSSKSPTADEKELHVKTNIKFENQMIKVDFSGYSFSSTEKIIDSSIVGYIPSTYTVIGNTQIVNRGYELIKRSYRSEDKFLCFVLANTHNHISYTMSFSYPNVNYSQSLLDKEVTNHAFTSIDAPNAF